MDVTDVYPQILNERLFRICFLFCDVYTHILRCVQIVGLKDYLVSSCCCADSSSSIIIDFFFIL